MVRRALRGWQWGAIGACAVMVVSLVASCGGSSHANPVTVTRDSDGIPHIRASNFHALGYGEAWAFSQDNFCTLAETFVTVNGERSKYFGANGASLDYSAGTDDTNLNSDFFWQSVKDSSNLKQLESEPPPLGPLPQVLDLNQGFVDGYNHYLSAGLLHDPRCVGKPWVRPITLNDMLLRGIQIALSPSSDQFITYEVNAAPPKVGASSVTGTPGAVPETAALAAAFGTGANASTTGSNGIGIGSQYTAAGDGMVLANPHFPWRGPDRFWMAQLTVPGTYNVLGGTLEGFPFIGIGFNQNLAWTHTVSTDYRFTFYQLKLVPGDPTSYEVDGKPEKMTTQKVTVNTGHGTATHTFYSTRWGRVVTVPKASYAWTPTTAYAVKDSLMGDTFRAENQYFEMGRATSVQDLLAIESRYLGIPTFNTIAADDTGHAYYGDVGNTPNVPQSLITACTPPGAPSLVYQAAGVVTLDGSRSSCAWAHDPGTIVPGIFSAGHEPHTIRTDYVENSNDSYWLANPSAPFPAYSPIIGKVGSQQGLRTRLGNMMIAKRVAGTDGFGPPKFTIPSLQAMWQSNQSLLAQLVLAPLVAACQATPMAKASNGTVVNLTQACAALASYDKTGNLDASGGWLFAQWAAFAPSSGGPDASPSASSGALFSDPFNPSQPLTTPSQLNVANPNVLGALANAVLNLQAHHIPLDATYGQVQHAPQQGHPIPIPGCDTGCYNAIYAANGEGGALDAAPYGQVYEGSSLVMTTELTPHGPVSEGILTYSQATDPTSPWYTNMTKLYSQKQWVPLRFTPAELSSDHGAKTNTLGT